MLFKETVAVYSEKRTKSLKIFFGQNAVQPSSKQVVPMDFKGSTLSFQ
jgi:hypothetical protein